ncbi:GrpB family protein [Glycomyces paridis]|nr:GrpB family protein [Glycomyces paridis]
MAQLNRLTEDMDMPNTQPLIYIADYDPDWARQAAEAIEAIRAAATGLFVAVEHIGSTAVPGLAAKPVIDLMAAVDRLEAVGAHGEAMAGLGFLPHENGMDDRVLFVRSVDGVRTHILHVVSAESWPTRNQRLLRDHLRAHPGDAARYGRLKREIAASGIAPGEYSRAKTALVQELTDRARAAVGLGPESVWEKRGRLSRIRQPRRSGTEGRWGCQHGTALGGRRPVAPSGGAVDIDRGGHMRRILSSAALAFAIGSVWAAPAMAGDEVAESVHCDATFSTPTALRVAPNAGADQIATIPAETWVSTGCIPFEAGGNHKTCTNESEVWVWAIWGDHSGYAHTGCMNRYNVH